MPTNDQFTRLTTLHLDHCLFQGEISIVDVHEMYPCLQTLLITNSKDLTSLLIRCQKLSKVELVKLQVIQVIDIEAPELLVLSVSLAFHDLHIPTPTARILSTKLTDLTWEAPYDSTRVSIRDLAPVLRLSAPPLAVCLDEGAQCSRLDMMCAQFLHSFWEATETPSYHLLFQHGQGCRSAKAICSCDAHVVPFLPHIWTYFWRQSTEIAQKLYKPNHFEDEFSNHQ